MSEGIWEGEWNGDGGTQVAEVREVQVGIRGKGYSEVAVEREEDEIAWKV
jgi:hypothetical protein